MKSPITGKSMHLVSERTEITYKKEKFEIIAQLYECEESGQRFSTDEQDELLMKQVHNEYRVRHGIPFAQDFVAFKNDLGLTSAGMSKLFELGEHTYRNYENGEIPSLANSNYIKTFMEFNSMIFEKLLERNSTLSEKKKVEIQKKVKVLNKINSDWNAWKFLERGKSIWSGYQSLNAQKINQMVAYFAQKMHPYKTKMNKLLFYADFEHFRQTGFSISGMEYKAIQRGPVPNLYDTVYDLVVQDGFAQYEYVQFSDYEGKKLVSGENTFNFSAFSELEKTIIQTVARKFKEFETQQIVDYSHFETAWKNNEENKNFIPYSEAFELKPLS